MRVSNAYRMPLNLAWILRKSRANHANATHACTSTLQTSPRVTLCSVATMHGMLQCSAANARSTSHWEIDVRHANVVRIPRATFAYGVRDVARHASAHAWDGHTKGCYFWSIGCSTKFPWKTGFLFRLHLFWNTLFHGWQWNVSVIIGRASVIPGTRKRETLQNIPTWSFPLCKFGTNTCLPIKKQLELKLHECLPGIEIWVGDP
jgi:hypothetical protein